MGGLLPAAGQRRSGGHSGIQSAWLRALWSSLQKTSLPLTLDRRGGDCQGRKGGKKEQKRPERREREGNEQEGREGRGPAPLRDPIPSHLSYPEKVLQALPLVTSQNTQVRVMFCNQRAGVRGQMGRLGEGGEPHGGEAGGQRAPWSQHACASGREQGSPR